MKITTTKPPAAPTAPSPAPRVTKKQALDSVVRSQAPVSLPAGRTNLATALKTAEAMSLTAAEEIALAELMRAAALSTNDVFEKALAAYKAPADREGARALFAMRRDAIAEEHGNAAGFLARAAKIAALLT